MILRYIILTILFFSFQVGALNQQNAMLENEKNSIQIFKRTVRSVVFVSNIQKVRRSFFDFEGTEIPAGAGTGYLWDKSGHIVTNFHVVNGGDKFLVSLQKEEK